MKDGESHSDNIIEDVESLGSYDDALDRNIGKTDVEDYFNEEGESPSTYSKESMRTDNDNDTSFTDEELEAIANGDFLGGNDNK